MFRLDADTAADYLRRRGWLAPGQAARVEELSGGVSNVVLRVQAMPDGPSIVLKQALPQLRVAQEWRCPVERIWREVEVLRWCQRLLGEEVQPTAARATDVRACGPAASGFPLRRQVPRLWWEDRPHYLYAMSAAPPEARTFKQKLLAHELDDAAQVATAAGMLLAALHARSWQDSEVAAALADRQFFEALRVDPYYRHVQRLHPHVATPLEDLIASLETNRLCLVHGDYSPKNLLVTPQAVWLIDFEVGHFGDPAFDLGFFLTHVMLKAVHAGPAAASRLELVPVFWQAYAAALLPRVGPAALAALAQRTLGHLAGCMLARVDGKSPVDYLTAREQAIVRDLACAWLRQPPPDLAAACQRLSQVASD
jgi:hypothetical protein